MGIVLILLTLKINDICTAQGASIPDDVTPGANQGAQNSHGGDQETIISDDDDDKSEATDDEMSVNDPSANDQDSFTASNDPSNTLPENNNDQLFETDEQSHQFNSLIDSDSSASSDTDMSTNDDDDYDDDSGPPEPVDNPQAVLQSS